jgi:hypothetical protein
MYINQIDKLIHSLLESSFTFIMKDKSFKNMMSDINFVKNQKEINNLLKELFKLIHINTLKKEISNVTSLKIVEDIIKKIMCYYLFLSIAIQSKGSEEQFIQNITEFTKNQTSYDVKINDFFNTNSNAIIIKYFKIFKELKPLFIKPDPKQLEIKKKLFSEDTLELLDQYDNDFILANFLTSDVNLNFHNVIKVIIVLYIYNQDHKKEITEIIESSHDDKQEYVYIDIVVQTEQMVDLSTIERTFEGFLTKKDKNDSYKLFQLLDEYLTTRNNDILIDDKINILLNHKLIIPITDEFLLYHKSDEKYDVDETNKEKETKIKYIISKIESVSELYNSNDSFKKAITQFYKPLLSRKAVLINYNETQKILNRIQMQHQMSTERNSLYHDLLYYTMYPYINFKKSEGFTFHSSNSVTAIRHANLDRDIFKPPSSSQLLETRCINQMIAGNIIGFAVPINKPIQCIRISEMVNIRDSNSEHLYEKLSKKIFKTIINRSIPSKCYYILFDPKNEAQQIESKFFASENNKQILSDVYDHLEEYMFAFLMKNIHKVSIQKGLDFIYRIQNRFVYLTESHLNTVLEKLYFFRQHSAIEYDSIEDQFNGLTEDSIQVFDSKSQSYMIPVFESKTVKNVSKYICQHNISWSALHKIQDQNKYDAEYYNFIKTYLTVNDDQQFVCVSCGIVLPISNHQIDGEYDKSTKTIDAYMKQTIQNIQDIEEFQKFNSVVKDIYNTIEKLGMKSEISQFTGNTVDTRSEQLRIMFTKHVIQLLIAHYDELKFSYKERNEKANKLYHINRSSSLLYFFNLDNSIYIHSSKDKDFYKSLKRDNILIYILLFFILELDELKILMMKGCKLKSKYIDFATLEKICFPLFANMKIITNKMSEIQPIQNYPVFMYVLSMLATIIAFPKYNFLYSVSSEETNITITKLFVSNLRIVIHTFVDLINSVLEIYNQNNAKTHFVYEIFSLTFYRKLNSIFKDDQFFSRIKNKVNMTKTKKSDLIDVHLLEIADLYDVKQDFYFDMYRHTHCNTDKMDPKPYPFKTRNQYQLSELTNCLNGEFHKWSVKNNIFSCKKCEVNMTDVFDKSSPNPSIIRNYLHNRINSVVTELCKNNKLHLYNIQVTPEIIQKCSDQPNYIFDKQSLKQFKEQLEETNNSKYASQMKELLTSKKKYDTRIQDVFKYVFEIKNKYSKTNLVDFIRKFIQEFEKFGDISIHIDNQQYFLKSNIYTLLYDPYGNTIQHPITLHKETDVSIQHNHPFYKTDVLILNVPFSKSNFQVYYDLYTKHLLGHKEKNKDYILLNQTSKFVHVNYSLENMLIMLGYPSMKIKNSIDSSQFHRLQSVKKLIQLVNIEMYKLDHSYSFTSDWKHIQDFFTLELAANNTNETLALQLANKNKMASILICFFLSELSMFSNERKSKSLANSIKTVFWKTVIDLFHQQWTEKQLSSLSILGFLSIQDPSMISDSSNINDHNNSDDTDDTDTENETYIEVANEEELLNEKERDDAFDVEYQLDEDDDEEYNYERIEKMFN